MRLAIVVLVVALAGCASFSYRKPAEYDPGATPADTFARESAGCELVAGQSRNNYGMGGLAGASAMISSYNEAFDACMRMKGYPRRP